MPSIIAIRSRLDTSTEHEAREPRSVEVFCRKQGRQTYHYQNRGKPRRLSDAGTWNQLDGDGLLLLRDTLSSCVTCFLSLVCSLA